MLILPVLTKRLKQGDDLALILSENAVLNDGDILVVSSKAIAMTEGAKIDLKTITPSEAAKKLSARCRQHPHFTQVVLDEAKRMNGETAGVSPHALLTSLRPNGIIKGRILCPNAGLDRSNVENGYAIGWPKDPVASARKLSEALRVPVIISDSCCAPSRLGVTAFALACCGLDPIRSEIGKPDLFGRPMLITNEAVADQLAVCANAVMGNSNQSSPAAIIRDHGIPRSDFCGWIDGIEPENDLFADIFDSANARELC